MRAGSGEIARVFLKLGATSFGGPAAHIAMMDEEIVTRRRWLTRTEFLDLVAVSHLIPGPNSTELALHIGRQRGGRRGLLVAGLCFILPAAIAVTILAWTYVTYGTTPWLASSLDGMKPVVLAVIVQALVRMGRAALRSGMTVFVAIVAATAALAGVSELQVLAGAALIAVLTPMMRTSGAAVLALAGAAGWSWSAQAAVQSSAQEAVPLTVLGLVFLKAGALLFGSGYVLLAFLHTDLVARHGWLTDAQLLDAIAVGQSTPGPVFTTATFVGYVVAGWSGALVATAAIFAPAFLFVAFSGPFIDRLKRSPGARHGLDLMVAASLGLMAAVAVTLGRDAVVDLPTAALFALALTGLACGLNSAALIVLGAAAGLALG